MTLDDLPAERLAVLRDRLVGMGETRNARCPLHPQLIENDPAANELATNLEHLPHAFVFSCLVDRQTRAHQAWRVPLEIRIRTGTLDLDQLTPLTEQQWVEMLAQPPAAHRYANIMGAVLYRATGRIADHYDGDASRIWEGTPSSARLVRRFLEFHGAGPKIATMAANILVRDFRIPVADRRYIDVSADGHVRRVMFRLGLVQNDRGVDEVIYAARELHPEYPGVFDLALWDLGRKVCRPSSPACDSCPLRDCCAYTTSAGSRF